MPKEITTPTEVQNEINIVAKTAMTRLSTGELWLHKQGYNSYEDVLAEMRLKIKDAIIDAIDKLERL